jgi:hypothetical protein
MRTLMKHLFLAIMVTLVGTGPALSDDKARGTVLYKGKTTQVKYCRATWSPKKSELGIDFATDPKIENRVMSATYRFKGTPSKANLENVHVLVGGSMNLGGQFAPEKSLTWVKQLVFEPQLDGEVQVRLEGGNPRPNDPAWHVVFNVQCRTTVSKVYE